MAATLTLDITDTLAHGVFPERRDVDEPLHDRWARSLLWRVGRLVYPPLARMRAAATQAEALAGRVGALGDEQIRQRLRQIAPAAVRAGRAEGLAEVLALCHTQGGHLQVHRLVPGGISLHVFFRAGDAAGVEGPGARARSTVTPFPFGRSQQRGNPAD